MYFKKLEAKENKLIALQEREVHLLRKIDRADSLRQEEQRSRLEEKRFRQKEKRLRQVEKRLHHKKLLETGKIGNSLFTCSTKTSLTPLLLDSSKV
jgi:hypothetical protein